MIVILQNIRSSHNVGSIFRTADAAHIKKIYLTGITAAPIDRYGTSNEKLTKVSLSAEKSVPWEHVSRPISLIKKLKKEGFTIVAIEQHKKSIPYYKFKLYEVGLHKVALVLGNEIGGISPAVLKLADTILEIPMKGKKESLNVAVAFGIVIFSVLYNK